MSDVTRSSGRFVAVTPSDTTDLRLDSGDSDSDPRALYVGGAGDVVAENDQGATVTFSSVPAGTQLAIRPRRVYSTNTTATNIVALY